ncbi:MAG: hypothetical protein AB4352_01290 [Hormoscilla sp.]
MHNCEPQPEIQQFCRKIANIAHIAWITETPHRTTLERICPQSGRFSRRDRILVARIRHRWVRGDRLITDNHQLTTDN